MESNLQDNNKDNILFVQVENGIEILLVVLFPDEAELIWSPDTGSGQEDVFANRDLCVENLLLRLVGGVCQLLYFVGPSKIFSLM